MQLNQKLQERMNRQFILKYSKFSYRRLALKWHPKLSKENPSTSSHYFCIASEAFEVLSDGKYI